MKIYNRRECAGPRGGRVILPTPCSECVAFRTCRPAAISAPWGCESWVDDDGRRALPEVIDREPVAEVEAQDCSPFMEGRRPSDGSELLKPGWEPWDEVDEALKMDLGPLFEGRS